MNHQYVLLESRGGIATVTLNDPGKLNPLSIPLQSEFAQVMAQIRSDDSIRAVILTGAGKAFCVGADLNSLDPAKMAAEGKSTGRSVAEMMRKLTNPIVTTLRALPVPTVSVVNGPAVGAGVGLALAADIVLAARSAYFSLPFMPSLGIIPDVGTTWFLPRMVGRARATGLTLLGNRLSASQAADWGLIWACLEDADLSAEMLSMGERLAALPSHAALEVRAAYDQAETSTLVGQLEYERGRQLELLDGPWFSEGVNAFVDKRKPIFNRRA